MWNGYSKYRHRNSFLQAMCLYLEFHSCDRSVGFISSTVLFLGLDLMLVLLTGKSF